MKYFRYHNHNKIFSQAEKERLASLGKDEEKKARKSKTLTQLIVLFGFILFFALLLMFFYFIRLIPKPTSTFLTILRGIGCVVLGIIGFIISVLTTLLITGPLLKKVEYNLPQMRKEFISKACEDIRKYYKLNDNYLITKCFESTNIKFINHDICIFRYENEIRITTDIVKGFINEKSDLGCYSIKFNELKIYKEDYNNKRVTILQFGKEKFIIGIKAYSYIKKLMMVKTYKYFSNVIGITEHSIYFKKRKKRNEIEIKDIENMIIEIPKYSAIPGSGYSYSYTFIVTDSNNKKIIFRTVLERYEEQEILDIIKNKIKNLEIKYYDNKNDGLD